MKMDGLLSIKQAAQYLACSEAMLRKWVHQRKLPVVKIGRLTRIRLDDLQAWVRLGLREKKQEVSS
jgi:excisionase family DNA binding protein